MTKRLEPDSFAPLAAHLEPIRHLAKAHQVARLEVYRHPQGERYGDLSTYTEDLYGGHGGRAFGVA